MGNRLGRLFEYQKFEHNSRLAELIKDTESRYEGAKISENDLDMVVAAAGSTMCSKGDGESQDNLLEFFSKLFGNSKGNGLDQNEGFVTEQEVPGGLGKSGGGNKQGKPKGVKCFETEDC